MKPHNVAHTLSAYALAQSPQNRLKAGVITFGACFGQPPRGA